MDTDQSLLRARKKYFTIFLKKYMTLSSIFMVTNMDLNSALLYIVFIGYGNAPSVIILIDLLHRSRSFMLN